MPKMTSTQLNDQIHHFSLSFFFSLDTEVPVAHCSPGIRADVLCHSFPRACPCSFPEQSSVWCCTPGMGAGGWTEKGEGVFSLTCSGVIRLSAEGFPHAGIICYSFSKCPTTVMIKVWCRLVRKKLSFLQVSFLQVFVKWLSSGDQKSF